MCYIIEITRVNTMHESWCPVVILANVRRKNEKKKSALVSPFPVFINGKYYVILKHRTFYFYFHLFHFSAYYTTFFPKILSLICTVCHFLSKHPCPSLSVTIKRLCNFFCSDFPFQNLSNTFLNIKRDSSHFG